MTIHPCAETLTAEPGRQTLCFDFDWRFLLVGGDEPAGGEKPGFDDRGWSTVHTPHDFSIHQPFDRDAPAGGRGGHLPGGVGWYRKTFAVAPEFAARRVWIEFDGVYRHSDVWCNGVHLGHRAYGYVGFRYELTDHLRPGEANVIAVRADNADQPNCRWYSGSGIYRHVRLVVTEPLAIAPWGVHVTTADELTDTATVRVRTGVAGASAEPASARLVTTLLDPDGDIVTAESADLTVPPSGTAEADVSVKVPEPRLWSPETPSRYQAVCELFDAAGRSVDRVTTALGIRRVELDAERGFLLNGRAIKLKGGNLHHDGGAVGAAVPVAVWRRRLEIIKSIGANTVRMSHNPPAPEVLDLCDRMGLMVYDEAFDKWACEFEPAPWFQNTNPTFDEDWRQDLDAMVLRDRNHPSVVIWSVGNEVSEYGQYPQRCVEIFRRLRDRVRELDTSRPITMALQYVPNRQQALHESHLAEEVDLISVNYQELDYPDDRRQRPDKLIIGSETKPYFTTDRVSRKGHFIPRNPWQDVIDHDYVIGGLLWTLIDYFGEANWPRNGWCVAPIDSTGRLKARCNYFCCLWSDRPAVRIQVRDTSLPIPPGKLSWDAPKMVSHWNWPDKVGDIVHVETPTNCETVELRLNGDSAGVQRTADFRDHTVEWYVPYEPGTLEAIGRNGEEEVARWQIETTGPAESLKLIADRTALDGSGHDAANVEIHVVDAAGRTVPDADGYVNVNVTGLGELLGLDNGDHVSKEPYPTPRRSTYFGQCLAVLRARRGQGTIRIRATSETLAPAELDLTVG